MSGHEFTGQAHLGPQTYTMSVELASSNLKYREKSTLKQQQHGCDYEKTEKHFTSKVNGR